MPRKPRFYLPGVPAHLVQRGNNRQAVFFSDDDYLAYLGWLGEGAEKFGCAVHAYVLMTNHVHLLVTPEAGDSISRMIQYVGRHYVTYINHTYQRSGTLWEGRHKGSLVQESDYLLACYRYIELNPVRAGMVQTPAEYRWSSYRFNTSNQDDALLTPHSLYLSLGQDDVERQRAYRELFRVALASDQIHAIRSTVQTGTPLGNDRFKSEVEGVLGRRVGQAKRGRPAKQSLVLEKGY